MTDWRPIEKCPNDGTWFLAAMPGTDIPSVLRPIGPNRRAFEGFHSAAEAYADPLAWMPLPKRYEGPK